MTEWKWTPPAGVTIGRGGYGTNPEIPMCPVCKAVGGGGHGGSCPNDGTDPATWVIKPDGWTPKPAVPAPAKAQYRRIVIEAVVKVEETEDSTDQGYAYSHVGALVNRLALKRLNKDTGEFIGVDAPVVKFEATSAPVEWPEKEKASAKKLGTAVSYQAFIQYLHSKNELPGNWIYVNRLSQLAGYSAGRFLYVIGDYAPGLSFTQVANRGFVIKREAFLP